MANQFLIKNTMADMRNLSASEIASLQGTNPTYAGVELLGYYEKGDTPAPIIYYLSTSTDPDDGGSVIEVQGVKLAFGNPEVDLKNFGGINDGNEMNFSGSDNKSYIISALKYVSKVKGILNIDGKYATSPIRIDIADITINMIQGSYLIGYTTMDLKDKLVAIGGDNININARGSYIIAPIKTEDEQNHILQIDSGTNISIIGLKVIGGGGDGFYIGNTSENSPTNIRLIDVSTYNCRRNGISIVNGINIKIIRPVCEHTVGTYPMAGIDIEPNKHLPEKLEGIYIESPITRDNKGYGCLVSLGAYTTYSEKNVDIQIVNHLSYRDGQDGLRGGLGIIGTGHTYNWTNKCNGIVRYTGQVFESGGTGMNFHSQNPDFAPLYEVDIYVQDCATKQTAANYYKSAIFIWGGAGNVNFPNGNLKLNVKVRDTRTIPLIFTDIYIYNPVQSIENINIIADVDGRTTFGNPLVCSNNNFKGNIYFKDFTKSLTSTTATSSSVNLFGLVNIMKNNISLTLPNSSKYIGQNFTFINGDNLYKNIKLDSGDKWDNVNDISHDIILNIKQTLKLKATTNGWLVIGTNDTIRYQFTNAVRPPQIAYLSAIPLDGIWIKGDIVYNLNVVKGQNIGWQCQVGGTPGIWEPFGVIGLASCTTSMQGLVKQTASSADIATVAAGAMPTKAEFDALLTEFRDLKLKSKASGQLAP